MFWYWRQVDEEKAFEIMKYMMFNLGFRRQYRPDMVPLQVIISIDLQRTDESVRSEKRPGFSLG